MKKYIATLILFIAVCLCGCSAINETLGLAKDMGITFSKDEAKEQKAIDSVTVNFKSAYWSEKLRTGFVYKWLSYLDFADGFNAAN